MKLKILGAVSALALMVAVTAYTEANATSSVATPTESESPILDGMKADVKANWNQAKSDFHDAVDNTKDSYEDFKAHAITQDATRDVTINTRVTAKGMLGQPVNDTHGKKIATLKDIILDKDGRAVLVVVSDGGFMGVGDKLAAFDSALVMQQQADGDVIMPLTDDNIKKAAAFSYDPAEASDKVQIVPADGYSVSALVKGQLVDPENKTLGNIENITFRGGAASQVIVAFDEKLGMNGQRAALDFDDLTLAKSADGTLDFRMNASQSAQFEQYKNTKPN